MWGAPGSALRCVCGWEKTRGQVFIHDILLDVEFVVRHILRVVRDNFMGLFEIGADFVFELF